MGIWEVSPRVEVGAPQERTDEVAGGERRDRGWSQHEQQGVNFRPVLLSVGNTLLAFKPLSSLTYTESYRCWNFPSCAAPHPSPYSIISCPLVQEGRD